MTLKNIYKEREKKKMGNKILLQANIIGGLNEYINNYSDEKQKVVWDTIMHDVVDTEEHLMQAAENVEFFQDILMFGATIIYGIPKIE